ncbi:MAG: hypothetical protein U1F68_07040 [Gammaproteobacteria bacterium]
MQPHRAGEVLERLEPRVAYNGADGVPICEEILSRHGDTIITRNAYGARCLNTPNVLFADIDFASEPRVRGSGFIFITLLIAASALGWMQGSWVVGVVALVLGLLIVSGLLRWLLRKPDNAEQRGLERIDQFVAEHPGWHLRLYRTPAGLRALAMQRTFDPTEPAVEECFKALAVDQVYVYMCLQSALFPGAAQLQTMADRYYRPYPPPHPGVADQARADAGARAVDRAL